MSRHHLDLQQFNAPDDGIHDLRGDASCVGIYLFFRLTRQFIHVSSVFPHIPCIHGTAMPADGLRMSHPQAALEEMHHRHSTPV